MEKTIEKIFPTLEACCRYYENIVDKSTQCFGGMINGKYRVIWVPKPNQQRKYTNYHS